jgi:hypothetical protein
MYVSINVPKDEVEIVEQSYTNCPHCIANLDHVQLDEFDANGWFVSTVQRTLCPMERQPIPCALRSTERL